MCGNVGYVGHRDCLPILLAAIQRPEYRRYAPPGPGQTLAIRIYQLSNRLGRGDPAAVILQF